MPFVVQLVNGKYIGGKSWYSSKEVDDINDARIFAKVQFASCSMTNLLKRRHGRPIRRDLEYQVIKVNLVPI